MLCSLLENTRRKSEINILIASNDINDENKKMIGQVVKSRGASLEFKDIKNKELEKFSYRGSMKSNATYYKLFVGELFGKNVKKVIYLDVDLILKDDICKLYDLFDDRKVICACIDQLSFSVEHKTRLGMGADKKYFNAGVLLINLNLFRKRHIFDKCLDYYEKNAGVIIFHEQDLLNGVLDGDWMEIDPEWNCHYCFYLKNCFGNYSKENIRKNAKLIHYTCNKPWTFRSAHPERRLYWQYLKKTPWKNYKYPEILGDVHHKIWAYLMLNSSPLWQNYLNEIKMSEKFGKANCNERNS